jgi:hydroxypyruvate isomerase
VNHVQVAGFPARNEPGGGGFSLPDLCDAIDRDHPDVWISAEYRPAKGTAQGLGWLTALKSRGSPIGT